MADYHILDCSEKKNAVRVAFHVAIPNTNNVVGTNWRTALSQWKTDKTSAVPGLDHQAALDSGEIVEVVATVEYSANDTDQEKLAAVVAFYNANKGPFLTRLQDILQYWGYSGNVA